MRWRNKTMIKVLIVDTSPVSRFVVRTVLERDENLKIVGEARNGKEALELISHFKPDIITIDISHADTEGLETTKRIMQETPIPIIAVTEPSDTCVKHAIHVIQAGALTVIEKPDQFLSNDANGAGKNLINSIKTLSEVKVVRRWNDARLHQNAKTMQSGASKSSIEIIGIATSTGGPNALAKLLNQLPDDFQIPIVIVQHIMKGFAGNFVTWLASVTRHHVKLAAQHELIQKNMVYIAPDDQHLTVNRFNRLVLSSDEPVKGHRPSADYLLFSIAKNYGERGMGIILTGMGDDGAEGMKAIKDAGGLTIAQNKDSSVIFGMPNEAINLNAVDKVVSIDKIGETIFKLTK